MLPEVALSGTIGRSASADMCAFFSLERELPTWESIMENPDTAIVPENLTARVILMFQAVDKVETQDDLTSFMDIS